MAPVYSRAARSGQPFVRVSPSVLLCAGMRPEYTEELDAFCESLARERYRYGSGQTARPELEPIYDPDRPREVRYGPCSADKARRLLDYRTTVSLRDGLQSIVEWISAHGTKPFEYHLPIEIESPLVPETWTARLL